LSLPTADGAPSDPAHDAASAKAPVVAKEINGLAIFWSLVKSWFGGLLGKKV
jgi:hypothetical protein